jgi:hypothetical protein
MQKPISTSPQALYQRMINAQNLLGEIKGVTESRREPESILNEIRKVFRPGPWETVEIIVGSISPTSAWPTATVQVDVTVINRTKTQTSGRITADLLQDGFNPIFSSGFGTGKGALEIDTLGPGQKVSGTVTLKGWRATPSFLKVGMQDLHLQYWIVVDDNDPRATISLYNPFTKTAINLAPISDAWDSLELYPPCQPNPPAFASEWDYLKINKFEFIGSSTIYKDDFDQLTQPIQSVVLSWDVASGGFPPVDNHPGSLGSLVLTGPTLGNGIPLSPSGQQKIDMGEIYQAEAAKPFVLTATGNCGQTQALLNVTLVSRPPVINFFHASPNDNDPQLGYVYLGKPAQLTWKYSGLVYGVSIVGTDEGGKTVFNAKHIVSYSLQVNSLQVTPSDNTKYVLTINGPGGSVTATLSVDVYNSQQQGGSVFFFKMTDDDSSVLPCFMLAIYAPDEASAETLAKDQNGGYDAVQVDENEFLAGC